jgi:hypothetical protein
MPVMTMARAGFIEYAPNGTPEEESGIINNRWEGVREHRTTSKSSFPE